MRHEGTRVLVTERLVLRRFTLEDAPAMYRNWASDDEVTKFLMWPAHADVEATRAVLTDWIAQYDRPEFYLWAIALQDNEHEPIGSISVVGRNDLAQMVHIGYCIGRRWWHQGVTSEALRGLLAYFFDIVGVNRVESRHDPRNPHSGAVMKKCGMQFEGTLREGDWSNQGICDADLYAILRKEYRRAKG